jgi:FixJ family two-component response regulator
MLKVRKDIPIILYIGYSHPVSPVKAKAAGISEFLMKPVTKKQLADAVRSKPLGSGLALTLSSVLCSPHGPPPSP